MLSIGTFTRVRIAMSAGAAGLIVSAAVPALLHGQSASDAVKAGAEADSNKVNSTATAVQLQVSGDSASQRKIEARLSPGQAQEIQITPGQTMRIIASGDSLDPEALQEIQKAFQSFQSLMAGAGKVIQLAPGTGQVIEIGPGQTMRVMSQSGPGGKGPQIITETAAPDSVEADSTGKGSKVPGDGAAPPSR